MSPPRVREEAPVSFLSRLGGKRPTEEPLDDARIEREILAVTRNLTALLNSKKGTGSVVPDLGLGDYEAYLSTRELLPVLVAEIGAQIARHEPRLAGPKVVVDGRDRDLGALFTVTGAVAGRPVRFRLALHTVYRGVTVTEG